jgi:hypothetical protein
VGGRFMTIGFEKFCAQKPYHQQRMRHMPKRKPCGFGV